MHVWPKQPVSPVVKQFVFLYYTSVGQQVPLDRLVSFSCHSLHHPHHRLAGGESCAGESFVVLVQPQCMTQQ